MTVLSLPWCTKVCQYRLLPAGGVPLSSLSECLMQEPGVLAVEMYGALVVGQGLAVTGIGGSQEAGEPIHCHWAWDGEMEEAGCSLLLSLAPVFLQQGWQQKCPCWYLPLILVTGEHVSTCRIRWTKSFGSCSWGGICAEGGYERKCEWGGSNMPSPH